jgi:hypothetical protein
MLVSSLTGCDMADLAYDRLVLGRPVPGDLAEMARRFGHGVSVTHEEEGAWSVRTVTQALVDPGGNVIAKQRLRDSDANAFLLLVSVYEFRYHLEARLSPEQLRPPPHGWDLDRRYRQTSEAIRAVRFHKKSLFSSATEADVAAVDGVDTAGEALAFVRAKLGDPSPTHVAEHLAATALALQLAPGTHRRYPAIAWDLERELWRASLPELLTTPGAFDRIASDGWDWRGSGKAGSYRVRNLGGGRVRLEIRSVDSVLVAAQLAAYLFGDW